MRCGALLPVNTQGGPTEREGFGRTVVGRARTHAPSEVRALRGRRRWPFSAQGQEWPRSPTAGVGDPNFGSPLLQSFSHLFLYFGSSGNGVVSRPRSRLPLPFPSTVVGAFRRATNSFSVLPARSRRAGCCILPKAPEESNGRSARGEGQASAGPPPSRAPAFFFPCFFFRQKVRLCTVPLGKLRRTGQPCRPGRCPFNGDIVLSCAAAGTEHCTLARSVEPLGADKLIIARLKQSPGEEG